MRAEYTTTYYQVGTKVPPLDLLCNFVSSPFPQPSNLNKFPFRLASAITKSETTWSHCGACCHVWYQRKSKNKHEGSIRILSIVPLLYAAVDYASLESIEFHESLSVIGLANKSRHSQRLVSLVCRMAS